MVHRRLVYIYLLNVPSFSSRYFNKMKRTSRLGRLLALSLEILVFFCLKIFLTFTNSKDLYSNGELCYISSGSLLFAKKQRVKALRLHILDVDPNAMC